MIVNLDRSAGGAPFNPASIHRGGRDAHDRVEAARAQIASDLECSPTEIFFTSGGCESNNWAIKGVAYGNQANSDKILVSAIEHPSILESAKFLAEENFRVEYLPVSNDGHVVMTELRDILEVSVVSLVSITALDSEIGTSQDIPSIARLVHDHDALLHCDMTQAAAADLDYCVSLLRHVDLATFSAHKLGGPVGIGLLYVKQGTPIKPLIHGGSQQLGVRAGTESVELAQAMAAAIHGNRWTLAERVAQDTDAYRVQRDLYARIYERIPTVKLNGLPIGQRLPNNLNICFPGIDAESLLLALSERGVYVSNGSACHASERKPSHILKAIGLTDAQAMSSLRLSYASTLSPEEIAYSVSALEECVHLLQDLTSEVCDES